MQRDTLSACMRWHALRCLTQKTVCKNIDFKNLRELLKQEKEICSNQRNPSSLICASAQTASWNTRKKCARMVIQGTLYVCLTYLVRTIICYYEESPLYLAS